MDVRRITTITLLLAGCWSLLLAAPAAASHDDHGPGTAVLDAGSGGGDLMVAFPSDADEDEIRSAVERVADAAGLELRGVEVVDNSDPDTKRVSADVRLTDRTGWLERHLPAEHIAPWFEVEGVEEVLVSTSRWARGDAIEPGGEVAVDGTSDVTFTYSAVPLLMPLLLTLLAGILPYLALRLYGRTVVGRDEPVADRLHRLRRATVVVQLGTMALLAVALFTTGAIEGVALGLTELFDGDVPRWVAGVAAIVGWLLPLLVAVAASAAAVVPYDRQLRSTEQSARDGAGDAVRMVLLTMVPVVAWVALLNWAPGGGGWGALIRLLIFLPAVAIFAPLLMNKVMRTREVDDELRERVLSRCREQGLGVKDVRLLDSRGGKVANAAISGVIPQLRYVYLTDHLVEVMDDDELDAVLAHEIAHGKGHHIVLKLLAGLAGMIPAAGLLFLLFQLDLGSTLVLPVVAVAIPLVMVTALVLAQGVVGVRLEQRADDRAAEAVGPEPLLRALENLADTNQLKRRTGWLWNVMQQHPGMEQRIERLRQQVGDAPAPGEARVGDDGDRPGLEVDHRTVDAESERT